jgi:hypothetical protein
VLRPLLDLDNHSCNTTWTGGGAQARRGGKGAPRRDEGYVGKEIQGGLELHEVSFKVYMGAPALRNARRAPVGLNRMLEAKTFDFSAFKVLGSLVCRVMLDCFASAQDIDAAGASSPRLIIAPMMTRRAGGSLRASGTLLLLTCVFGAATKHIGGGHRVAFFSFLGGAAKPTPEAPAPAPAPAPRIALRDSAPSIPKIYEGWFVTGGGAGEILSQVRDAFEDRHFNSLSIAYHTVIFGSETGAGGN